MTDETKAAGKTGNACHPIKEPTTGAVPGTGNVLKKTVEAVSDGVSCVAQEAGKAGVAVVNAVADVTRSVVHGALATGNDVVLGVKAIAAGTVRSPGEKEKALNRKQGT